MRRRGTCSSIYLFDGNDVWMQTAHFGESEISRDRAGGRRRLGVGEEGMGASKPMS